MMMDPEAAKYHALANKPALAAHTPTTGAPEMCVDHTELLKDDPSDPRQHTKYDLPPSPRPRPPQTQIPPVDDPLFTISMSKDHRIS